MQNLQPASDLPSHILDAMRTALLVLDDAFRVQYLNAAAEDLLKTSLRASRGHALETFMRVSPRLAEQMREVLHQQAPLTDRAQALHVHDWDEILADISLSPLTTGLLLELSQIDRHPRIDQEAQRMQQYAMTQEVVRGLAHEIKNPLSGIRGAAQLLERHLQDPALQEYTGIIVKEADRLSRLLTRLQGGQDRPQLALASIHQVLEYVRRLADAELPTGIALRFDYDPSIPDLQADAEQLIQLFLNLVRNAIQALGQAGQIILRTRVERQCVLGAQRYRLALRVEIEDNGPGVPPEWQSRIFLPLVTGRADGVGLGLSIAQSLATGHGGLIELKSVPGCTRFIVYLPMSS